MYQQLNLPINVGDGILTPECAYFLGAIFSADESFIYNQKKYWLAPVRHNFGQDIQNEINEHMILLSQIIGRANGRILTRDELKVRNWFNSGVVSRAFTTKQGFAALFESEETTNIDSLIDIVISAMNNSPQEVRQAFVVGAFDGRSALDTNKKTNKIRYLVLDCANLKTANYLSSLLTDMGIEFNYNTARDRLEGGAPRKEQLRIPGNNIPLFMESIGIVSPLKFELIRECLDSNLHIHNKSALLWGLKTLSDYAPEDNDIILISEEEQEIENSEDSELIVSIRSNIYSQNKDFEYSATPKQKSEPIEVKGRQVYKRNKQVSVNALNLAGHKCEIDDSHPSFLRRNSDILYAEPHHLIPMAFSYMFENSLDIEQNIVSLCSNCHNQLHYGRDIRDLLRKLYDERIELLRSVGIDLTFEALCKMYNA